MKNKSPASFLLAGILALAATLRASEAPSAPATQPSAPVNSATATSTAAVNTQVQGILEKIKVKLAKKPNTEADFAPEIAELDALIAAHKSEKTDAVAMAEYYKGLLYLTIRENDKGLAVYKQLAQDFPDTSVGREIAKMIPQLEPQVQAAATAAAMQAAAAAAQKDLVVGKPFPPFAVSSGPVKDLAGKELSIAQYKGKVVLIDFWATWCGPCMAEMPNVIAAYNKYHAKGFDIIGVSLDNPSGLATLPAFLTQNKMPWRQFCDGKMWSNELAVKYGIMSIPASYLLDGNGNIIALSPRGPALAPAIEAALAANKS